MREVLRGGNVAIPIVRLFVGVVGAEKMFRHPPPSLTKRDLFCYSEKSSSGRELVDFLLAEHTHTHTHTHTQSHVRFRGYLGGCHGWSEDTYPRVYVGV